MAVIKMIAAERIASVLGLPGGVRSLAELQAAVARGLPKASLRRVAGHVSAISREQWALVYGIVPEATYKRRRDTLKPEESARTERLARVVATAEYVWDDVNAARRFLTTPHPALRGERPLDAARTELDARRVEELLWQIVHGLPV